MFPRSPRSPIQIVIELPGALQVLQLLQPSERTELVSIAGHIDSLEQATKFLCSAPRVPAANEPGKPRMNLVERHAVAVIVSAGRTDAEFAPREDLRNDLRDFTNAVVLRALADVEDLTVYRFGWSLGRAANRLADIFNMNDRPPRTAVARHRDFLAGPREGAEVVQHNVESHPRRRPVSCRVA